MACEKCKETTEKYRELREAVVDVVGNALPHYDGRKVVSKRAMDRLAEALMRLDGGPNEANKS